MKIKKTKVSSKEQVVKTNGMVEDINTISKLQEALGSRIRNPFGAKTQEELEEKLKDMFLVDLQKMAVSAGISANGDRSILKNRIRSEFGRFLRGSHGQGVTISKEGLLSERELSLLL